MASGWARNAVDALLELLDDHLVLARVHVGLGGIPAAADAARP
jgi:hypothetical protein